MFKGDTQETGGYWIQPPNINIDLLKWEPSSGEIFEPETLYDNVSKTTFNINGVELEYIATNKDISEDKDKIFRVYITMDGKQIVKGYVYIHPDSESTTEEMEAGVGIARIGEKLTGENKDKLKDVARKIYLTLLDIIQQESNQRNKQIIHTAVYCPDYPATNEGMTLKQWEEKFSPLLTSKGYTKKIDGAWQKTYKPQQTQT